MYIGEALYSKLIGDSDVSALVSTRIYPNVIPQDAALPALAFQQISRPGSMAHDGPPGIAWPRFQITAQADTYDEVDDLINKVRIALDGVTGLWGGTGGVIVEGTFVKDIRDGYEFATERETKRMDVVIFYREDAYFSKVLGIQRDNLILYHPMNEASGAIAVDSSPEGNNGAYTGVTLGQEGIGDGWTCPLFDGANDYNDIETAGLEADFDGSEFTMAVWLKMFNAGVWTDSTNRKAWNMQMTGGAGNNNIRFERLITNNTFRGIYQANSINKIIDITMSDTDWFHIAMTVSSGADEMKVFKDGVQQGSTQAGLGSWSGSFANIVIGATSVIPSNVFYGWIAHPAIWNAALAPAKILSLATV